MNTFNEYIQVWSWLRFTDSWLTWVIISFRECWKLYNFEKLNRNQDYCPCPELGMWDPRPITSSGFFNTSPRATTNFPPQHLWNSFSMSTGLLSSTHSVLLPVHGMEPLSLQSEQPAPPTVLLSSLIQTTGISGLRGQAACPKGYSMEMLGCCTIQSQHHLCPSPGLTFIIRAKTLPTVPEIREAGAVFLTQPF